MVSRLPAKSFPAVPIVEVRELRTESDVEQKVILPFLLNASYLSLRSSWIRTKEYMTPTQIDKAAGKKYGYIPDYSIWLNSIPLVIVEAISALGTENSAAMSGLPRCIQLQTALRYGALRAGVATRFCPGCFLVVSENTASICRTKCASAQWP